MESFYLKIKNKILTDAAQKAAFKNKSHKVQEILDGIESIRNAQWNGFPLAMIGLPEWEPVLLILEEKLELEVLIPKSMR